VTPAVKPTVRPSATATSTNPSGAATILR
jgi:hypothetical protein